MHRFRGNIWDYDSRPQVMRTLGYPLAMSDRIPDITEARNIELGLGLQVLFFSFFASNKVVNIDLNIFMHIYIFVLNVYISFLIFNHLPQLCICIKALCFALMY